MPDHKRLPRAQRFADALVSIAQDSLDGNHPEETGTGPIVSIFIDARLAAETNGEAGATIDTGPRVGPLTLEQILCDSQVEILTTTPDGTPLTVGPTTRTIPPKLRRSILHRDGGACTADGCQSRYRLQPHHIQPRSSDGTHKPDNLTTLWLVPPPRRHPPQRLPHRPQHTTPTQTLPQTGRPRPTPTGCVASQTLQPQDLIQLPTRNSHSVR
jgi:hypothetical protein